MANEQPDFASAMLTGLDALDGGVVPDSPPPVVDDSGDGDADAAAAAAAALEGAGGDDSGDGDGSDDAAGGDEGSEGASGEAPGEGDPADAGNTRPRNADGTFKSKEQLAAEAAAAPALGADGKPVVKPAVPAKAPDPINDPIPAGLKPATTERMTKLVTVAKELTTRAELAENDRDLLLKSVADTGMQGEEFGEFLNVVGDARSDDPGRVEKAYTYLTEVLATVAAKLGKAPPGVDPLTGHDDLIARVNASTLTRADATEIANSRRTAQAATTRQQQGQRTAQQQQAQQEQLVAARTAAAAQMTELEQTLAIDPNFAAKKAIMAKDAAFVQSMRAAHPSQWVTMFSKKYRETKVVAATPPAGARTVPGNSPQPLRGKTPAGGGQVRAPKSVAEAIGGIDFSKV